MRNGKDEIFDVYIVTNIGNDILGGTDIWLRDWLSTIPQKLDVKPVLLVDNRKSDGFDDDLLSIDCVFYGDEPDKGDDILKKCRKIHFLTHFFDKRPHILRYKDKFESIVVHLYLKDYNQDSDQDELIENCNKKIWVGLQKGEIHENYDDVTDIPNFYEFVWNRDYVHNNVVGYAAVAEPRKQIHFLKNVRSNAFTSPEKVKDMGLNMTKVVRYNGKLIEEYFNGDTWGIFHGAYDREPFGYSIFQSVDAGKIPIVDYDWCPQMGYLFRSSTQDRFETMVKKIKNSTKEYRQNVFNSLKKYLKKYDNKQQWIENMVRVYNNS